MGPTLTLPPAIAFRVSLGIIPQIIVGFPALTPQPFRIPPTQMQRSVIVLLLTLGTSCSHSAGSTAAIFPIPTTRTLTPQTATACMGFCGIQPLMVAGVTAQTPQREAITQT